MKKGLYTAGFIALICTLVISSVQFFSFQKSYYAKTYTRLQTAETIGITQAELDEATTVFLDYIVGSRDNLDYNVTINGAKEAMFNQREIDHMVDVQVLMIRVLNLRNVLGVFSILVIAFAIYKKDYKDLVLMKESLQLCLMIMGLILGFIGIYAIVDFDAFWIQFHKVLFSNDLWLLDPRTDRLIMMVPQEFFSGLVYRIIGAIGVIVVSFIGLYIALGRRISYVAHRTL